MLSRLKENEANEELKDKVATIEDQLGKEAEENHKMLKEMCKEIGDSTGCMNMLGVWKHFKKLNPKILPTLPVAKTNLNGELVTNIQEAKDLLLNTFVICMKYRPIRPDLLKLQHLRQRLLQIRLTICRKKKS